MGRAAISIGFGLAGARRGSCPRRERAREAIAGACAGRAGRPAALRRSSAPRPIVSSHDRMRSARCAPATGGCQARHVSAACGAAMAWARAGRGSWRVLLEQLDELVGHGAGELGRVGDGDGAAIVARHVVADADGDQLDRGARLDLLDHLAQVLLQIAARVDRQRGVVDRRAVGDHHQDAAPLGPSLQAPVRPGQRLAVDVLLEQALAHHQRERALGAPPGRIGRLVDDVAQVVEAARDWPACRPRARPRAPGRPSRPGW